MRIVYMGTADFDIPAFKRHIKEKIDIAGVVTAPPRPKGRGLKLEDSPVAIFAHQNRLGPIFTPEDLKDTDFIQVLSKLKADLFVVIAYRILPGDVFRIPPLGTVNIHASLLPKFRGAAPIQRAIEAGEKETGISIFQINKGIDTGKIIVQKRTPIGVQETTPQLYERLSKLGADALMEAFRLLQGETVTYIQQNPMQATHAPKLTKEESWIDWDLPAQELFNKIRAFKAFPGTRTVINGKQVRIEWAVPVEGSSEMTCGTICTVSPEWFEVQCQNSRLRIMEVKPAGKKVMHVQAFLNGTKIEKGMKVG